MSFTFQLTLMWYRFFTAALIVLNPFLINAQVASIRLIVSVPPLAEDKTVFVCGSFNAWKAGDSLYKMKRQDATTYSIVLPVYKNIRYQYKYTTGGWNEVEIALNDSSIKNRSFLSTTTKKKIRDTVIKWAAPNPTVPRSISPQMARINAMKDSVLSGLQPKLNEMLQLLKEYTINLLQVYPSMETDNRITADVTNHFADAYGRINGLFHKVFASMTPEQKQRILTAVTAPGAEKDFINALGAAVNEAMK